MTDPQLPPPSGAVPPVPPAPAPAPPAAPAPGVPAPPVTSAPPVAPAPPVTSAPGYPAAPPGAYQVPVGGYAAPVGTYAVPDTAPKNSKLVGTLALVFALVAAVAAPIIAGINGFEIGRAIPQSGASSDDLSFLSPVRDQVLWTEVSFWTGTVLGIAAIVLGIIAIRKRQGRGAGIAALIVAVLGAVIFSVVLLIAITVGSASGMTILTS